MNIFHELGIRDGNDRINEEVIYNVARAYTIIDSVIGQFLSAYGLGTAKFNILLMVKHVGKETGLPQRRISKLLLVTTSNITRMIDKLEKDGFVERVSQEGDRRVKLVRITQNGSDLLDAIWPEYKQKVDDLVESNFSGEKKASLNIMLEQFKKIGTEQSAA